MAAKCSCRPQNMICLVVLVWLVAAGPAMTAIPCNQVVNLLIPCINYVLYGGTVPPPCCAGVQSLYDVPKNSSDRRDICVCLKSISEGIPSAGPGATDIQTNAAAIPTKCGLNLDYKIRPSTDCKSVK